MIWVVWLLVAALVAVLSKRAGVWAIVACILAVQVGKAGLQLQALWVWTAFCSVATGYALAIYGGATYRSSALLMVAAGVLVSIARFSGGVYGFGNIWLSVSDLSGVAAIIQAGYPDTASRIWRVVRRYRISRDRGVIRMGEVAAKKVRSRYERW